MSDIFLSYAKADRDELLPLVKALEDKGWNIFWDRKIPIGKTWHGVLAAEIEACKCMLVVWSNSSVQSEWVREEAQIGKDRQIIFPVSLDGSLPPLGFGGIQSANLSGWQGEENHPEYQTFIRELTDHMGSIKGQIRVEKPESTDSMNVANVNNSNQFVVPAAVSPQAHSDPYTPATAYGNIQSIAPQEIQKTGTLKKLILGGVAAAFIAAIATFGVIQYNEKVALESAQKEMELERKKAQEAQILAEKIKKEEAIKAEAIASAKAEVARENARRIAKEDKKRKKSAAKEAANLAKKRQQAEKQILADIARQNAAQNAKIRADANLRAKQQQEAQRLARQRADAQRRAQQQQAQAAAKARQKKPSTNNSSQKSDAFAEGVGAAAAGLIGKRLGF